MPPVSCSSIAWALLFLAHELRFTRPVAISFLMAASCLSAARAEPTAGHILGVVANEATHLGLASAEVILDGTTVKTLTDQDGFYCFSSVAPGRHTLVATSAGLAATTHTVTVVAGQTDRIDFNMRPPAHRMEEFVVVADSAGGDDALERQKNSDHFMLAISADRFESSPDGNLGEILKFIPGLQVNYADGQASTVSFRGQDAAMTSVMIGGVTHAAAGTPQAGDASSRAFEFNQMSIQTIESVEVYKAPPPSMPPALGGIVNVVPRSGFLQKGRRVQLSASLNAPSRHVRWSDEPGPGPRRTSWIKPGGSLSYSEAFLKNRLGVSLTLSESNLINSQYYNQASFAYRGVSTANPIGPNSSGYLSSYTLTDTPVVRQSRSVGLSLDYRWSGTTILTWRNGWNSYHQQTRQRTFRISGGTATTASTPYDTTLTGAAATMLTDFNDTSSRNLNTSFRVDHKFRAWKIDCTGSFSRSGSFTGDLPDFFATNNVSLSNVGLRVQMAPGRPSPTALGQISGANLWNLASYGTVAAPTSYARDQRDRVWSAAMNVRRDFVAFRFPFYLQSGGSYGYFHRDKQGGQTIYTFLGSDGKAGTSDDSLNPAAFRDTVYAISPLHGFPKPDWLDPYKVADYRLTNPAAFQDIQAANYERRMLGTQDLTQEIVAGYFMGNVRLGRATVLSGFRVEDAITSGVGPKKRASLGSGLPVNSLAWYQAVYAQTYKARSDYADPLLQVQGTYRFTPNFLFRTALYQTIGRPDIYRILQNTAVDDVARTVSINDVAIIPQHSNNLDLGIELYTKPTGTASIGWFRKSIHDYIQRSYDTVDFGADNGFNGAYGGYRLTTQTNTGNARFEGFEASFRQQMTPRAPALLRGLELSGNFTRNYRAEGSFGTTSITTPLNYAGWSANGGVSYTSPSRIYYFLVRCIALPRTLSARATATSFARYDEAHQFWDFTARYRFLKKYTLEVSGSNITRDPRIKWTQGPNRPVDYREFDAQWTLTLSGAL